MSELRAPGMEGPPIEFGTILVFTCSKSCWAADGSGPRRETVVVQAERM